MSSNAKDRGYLTDWPHMGFRGGPKGPGRWWECMGCGKRGDLNELNADPEDCTACIDKAPCLWCDETPLCAVECAGVALALSGVGLETTVHVIE